MSKKYLLAGMEVVRVKREWGEEAYKTNVMVGRKSDRMKGESGR